ncbi:Wzz/FepE/Etk N-terminal domain-containing protein [Pseudoalteromonas sp. BZB3]|uniref:Wzz/FepE/Etk N-terminal domain-containing protein n=1 Tax=Pseudoalteromonas sp. BZB3 TaxID=3136670 RepID=UPI0032C43844
MTNLMAKASRQEASELELTEIIKIFAYYKWLIVAITFLASVAGVVYALQVEDVYKAEATLSPVKEQSESAGQLGQLGGLASLAGLNVSSSNNKVTLAIEKMSSRRFIINLIEKNNLLPELFAVKSWNKETDTLIFDDTIFNSKTMQWVEKKKPRPSLQKAYYEFLKVYSVSQAKSSGLVKVKIEHISPSVAKKWVDLVVSQINVEMKNKDVLEAKKSISFLEKQLKETSVVDIRSLLHSLIEGHVRTIMFSQARDEYILSTIDPAIIEERKVAPNRAFIVVLFVLIGGFSSFILSMFLYIRNKQNLVMKLS